MKIANKSAVAQKPTNTIPVAVFLPDRLVIRALAGASGEIPAAIVRKALTALLDTEPSSKLIADAVRAAR